MTKTFYRGQRQIVWFAVLVLMDKVFFLGTKVDGQRKHFLCVSVMCVFCFRAFGSGKSFGSNVTIVEHWRSVATLRGHSGGM